MKNCRATGRLNAIGRSGAHLVLALSLSVMSGSCDDPTTGIASLGREGTSLSVAPPVLTLDNGATGVFTPRLTGPSGEPITARNLEWTSLQPGVASVTSTGVIRANHPGQATIRVRAVDYDLEQTAIVIVRPVADEVLFLVRDEILVGTVGMPLPDSVEVRVIDRGGLPVPGYRMAFGIESGGGSVSPGIVVTDANGYAKVEWTLGTAVGSNGLLVTQPGSAGVAGPAAAPPVKGGTKVHGWGTAGLPNSIEVTPPSDTINVEDSNRLTATVLDKWGNDVEGMIVEWQSEADDVASVDTHGTVRGLKEGDATITAIAYLDGGAGVAAPGKQVRGQAFVSVRRPSGTSLGRVAGSGQVGSVGMLLNEALVVRALDPDGRARAGVPVNWSVSAGGGSLTAAVTMTDASGQASVGWILGPHTGSQEVTAWSEGVENTVLFTSTAQAGSPTEVIVTPAAVNLAVDASQQFTASVYDSYGNKITDRPVTWSTTDPFVLKVDVGGYATAVSPGSGTVTATLDAASGTAQVTVEGDGGSGGGGGGAGWTLAVSPPTATSNALGAVVQLTATVTDADGSYVGSAPVQWTSLNPEVASVDQFGRVVSRTVGVALITAATTGSADTARVESRQVVASVHVDPAEISLESGATLLARAFALDSLGSEVPGQAYEWSTTDSNIVGVDKAPDPSTTWVVARSSGSAAIMAKSGTFIGSASVVVDPVPVASISVSPDTLALGVGEQGMTTVMLLDATGKEITGRSVGWDSSDPTVATVVDGVVTAVGTGEATVSARVDDKSDDVTVLVLGGSNPPPGGPDAFRAFPGAEGHGAMALTACGRGGTEVLRVTNLNDSGSGSLRAALEGARGDRLSLVLFDVGGLITLGSRIEVQSSCIYVAGQTAPGSGITIRAPDRTAIFLKGKSVHDVAFRYLRIRNGTNSPGSNTGGQGLIVGAGTDVIVDHLSFSWAGDQLFMVYHYPNGWTAPQRVTLQNTLLSDPLSSSPVCYSTKGDVAPAGDGVPPWYRVSRVSFHHNVAINCSHRAPMISSRDAEVINNVVYNWNQGAMHTEGRKPWVDYVGNYFKAGPMNRTATFGYEFSHKFMFNRPGGWNGQEPDNYVLIGNDRKTWDGHAGPSLYLSGNRGPHTGSDQWSMTSKYKNDGDTYPESNYSSVKYAGVGLMPIEVGGVSLRRNSPLPAAPVPVSVESAQSAWDRLVGSGDVGANRRVTCDGKWVGNQDSVDQRALGQARAGSGPSASQLPQDENDAGGYPSMTPGSKCADADRDGMPDAFEERFGFNKSSASDALLDADNDGYTNLEEYVNGSNPR